MSVPTRVFEQTLADLFAPILSFLDHDDVSEIMINGYDEIYIEKHGKLEQTDVAFASEHALMSAIRNLSQFVGREVNQQKPILEGRLPDGSRVEAVLPPASPRGPVVSIRRFRRERFTLPRLVEQGAMTADMSSFLQRAVEARKNVIVAGGSGSGKTSLLSALASLAHPRERMIVLEDSKELRIERRHVVQLEAQPPDASGSGEVSIRDLFHATLRLRPDRIVIGEIRGGEALELIQAMTSGHRGCLSTIHATLPIDTLSRLETLALMSDANVPLAVLRGQIASAIDLIVQVRRQHDGSRHVSHISEVVGYDPGRGYCLAHPFVDAAGCAEAS